MMLPPIIQVMDDPVARKKHGDLGIIWQENLHIYIYIIYYIIYYIYILYYIYWILWYYVLLYYIMFDSHV